MEGEPDASGREMQCCLLAGRGWSQQQMMGQEGNSQEVTSGIIYTYFGGQLGPRKPIMMVISGKQMINPNFSTSASAVFFISIFFF